MYAASTGIEYTSALNCTMRDEEQYSIVFRLGKKLN